ncbi:MAG: membrane-bound lytic murein transglycosylase MltF [Gammaproteobacteria bacterium]|nr:membrane-bound lytic murein transglycosylase MltF [Gammaproteobacteria bacterium]
MNIKQALVILADRNYKGISGRLALALAFITIFVFWLPTDVPDEESHLQEIINRGSIRVITRESPTTYYTGYQGADGVEFQLVNRFAEKLGIKLEITTVESITEVLAALRSGSADIAAAGLSITPERKVEFVFAPPYQEVSQKLVFKQGKRWPRNIEQLNGELRVMADSSHAQKLLDLKQQHPSLSWTETETQTSEDLLAEILSENIDYTITDSNELALNRRFYPELAIGFSVGEPEQLAWAFHNKKDDSLRSEAINFFATLRQSGELAHLMERHYGHVEDFDYVGTRKFLQAAKDKLPRYSEYFHQASKHDLDWRLLAAISYQESHWKPKARSPTGVRGMMMLTLRTAKQLGVKNRLDPEQSIKGGARYFSKVYSRIPEDIPEPDRTWFTLAAYNIGWGHVEDARRITEKQGADPDRWVDVKERLPLLRQKKYYRYTRYGYARGDEPVQYVDNIRRYYETLQWMTDEADQKLKQEQEALIARQLLAEKTQKTETEKPVATKGQEEAEEAQTDN